MRRVSKFMDGTKAQDTAYFPPLDPMLEHCGKLYCDLGDVTVEESEFSENDHDIFYFDKSIISQYPEALPVFSLAAKTATAMLHSGKYIRSLDQSISEHYTNDEQSVKAMSLKDVQRVKCLLNGGFKVQQELLHPEGEFFKFDGSEIRTDPRRVALNSLFLHRIWEAALESDSSRGRRSKLRRFAALMAMVLFNYVGAYSMHTMIKHTYFSKEDKLETNLKLMHGSSRPGFARHMELSYFHAIPIMEAHVDLLGNARHFDIMQFSAHFPELMCTIAFDVRSNDFSPTTYDEGGGGLFGAEIENVRRVGATFKEALDARTAKITRNNNVSACSTEIAVPGPDEFDGDKRIKLGLVYNPSGSKLNGSYRRFNPSDENLQKIEGNSVGSKRR